jgi:hypothetical protein
VPECLTRTSALPLISTALPRMHDASNGLIFELIHIHGMLINSSTFSSILARVEDLEPRS